MKNAGPKNLPTAQPVKAKIVPDVDISRWIVIYPVYINSRKTVAEGRRITKPQAVDNPTCQEIQQVCVSLKLQSFIEVGSWVAAIFVSFISRRLINVIQEIQCCKVESKLN